MFAFSILKKLRGKKTPFCSAVIAAAGNSHRMDGEDKIFAQICGAPALVHTLKAFESCRDIKEIIIVTRSGDMERVADLCKAFGITKAAKTIVGGQTRLSSVLNGVHAVSKKADLVAIHDGARPCVEQSLIERTVKTAAERHAAAPAVAVTSTLKKIKDNVIADTVDREGLFEIQTPQVFRADVIKAALTKAANKSIEVTDDCQALELIGFPVYVTEGSSANIKLTTSEDISLADSILRARL